MLTHTFFGSLIIFLANVELPGEFHLSAAASAQAPASVLDLFSSAA